MSLLLPVTWVFSFDEMLRIQVLCPWRLIFQTTIAVSGEDHGQEFGLAEPVDAAVKANAFLANRLVQQVEVREGTADLLIHFDGGIRLEIIPFSSGVVAIS